MRCNRSSLLDNSVSINFLYSYNLRESIFNCGNYTEDTSYNNPSINYSQYRLNSSIYAYSPLNTFYSSN